jgi:hypothetical protein
MVYQITEEELLEEIHRLAEGDTPPTQREMGSDGRYNTSTYHDRFGSWNAALRQAGFPPNLEITISTKDLLTDLRDVTDRSRAPSQKEYNKEGNYSTKPITDRTTWWQGVVRAGLAPRSRWPLSESQFADFHTTVTKRSNPQDKLIGLLTCFTGLPPTVLKDFERSWVNHLTDRYDVTVTVPPSSLVTDSRWEFKIPETFTTERNQHQTQLPSLLKWYFNQYDADTLQASKMTVARIVNNIADNTAIDRPITSSDLRATIGVHMARNGAPRSRIRRHLGIEYTGWDASVDDFFLWLYVHEGYEHPDYDPPDIVLDPV